MEGWKFSCFFAKKGISQTLTLNHMSRITILLIVGLLSFYCSAIENNIKTGTARLSVIINHADSVNIDNAVVWVDTAPVFVDAYDNLTFKLEGHGNVFSGEVPLEQLQEVVGIRFECDSKGFGYMAILYQDTPVELTFTIGHDYIFTEDRSSDPYALSKEDWRRLNTIFLRFTSLENTVVVPAEMYDSWERVRDFEKTVQFPEMMKYALEGEELPDNTPEWFVNSLKTIYAARNTIPYTAIAARLNGITVEEPPMESYSFLDNLDYSTSLLMRLPYNGMKSFIYALLRFPEGGFGKIGEEPVAQWQARAKEKMLTAVSNPSQLLLDLLAAMSYVEQIDIHRQPLSATQISNVLTGFSGNDLDKIIIGKNAKLMASGAKKSNVLDLSAVSFNLKRYIDKMYKGKPVIVDLWNTWCSPCLDAIAKTEILRKELPESDIVFLYISDESSDFDEWERRTADMDGVNLRICKEDSETLGAEYGLIAFPSYLIFNRSHELVQAQTGFPGVAEYKKWVEKIIGIGS